MPDSRFILDLCSHFDGAIALTSANISGADSPRRLEDFPSLWPQCGVLYDGGEIAASPLGSTIVNLSEPNSYTFIRPGVAPEQTAAVLSSHGIPPKL